MATFTAWITDPTHLSVIFACLFAVSECLGMIPSVKANSVFQFLLGLIVKGETAYPVK